MDKEDDPFKSNVFMNRLRSAMDDYFMPVYESPSKWSIVKSVSLFAFGLLATRRVQYICNHL